ncbi:MAG: hypothetical protein JJV89_04480 [Desulfosarcina sp.]|nr:hypothetical protein [Desulfobacterales bacterium]
MATASSQSEGSWSFRDDEGNQITLPESKIGEYMKDDNMRDLVLDLIVSENEGANALEAAGNIPDANVNSSEKTIASMESIKGDGTDINTDTGSGLLDTGDERTLDADKPSPKPVTPEKKETGGWDVPAIKAELRTSAYERLYADAEQYADDQAVEIEQAQVPPIKTKDVNAANFNVWKEQTSKGLIDHLVEKIGYDPAETSVEQLYEKKWAEIGEQINQETFENMFPDELYVFGLEKSKNGAQKQQSYDKAIQAQKKAIYKAIQKEHSGYLATRDTAVREQEKMFKELQKKLNSQNIAQLQGEQTHLKEMAKLTRASSSIYKAIQAEAENGDNTDAMKLLKKRQVDNAKQLTNLLNIKREQKSPTSQVGISQEQFDDEKIQKIKLPKTTMDGIKGLTAAPKDQKLIANFVKTAMYKTKDIGDSAERSAAIKQIVIEMAKKNGIDIKTIFPEKGKANSKKVVKKQGFAEDLRAKKKPSSNIPPGKQPLKTYSINQPKAKNEDDQ